MSPQGLSQYERPNSSVITNVIFSHVALWQRSYFLMLHHDKRDNFSCCIMTNVIFLMLYYDNRDIFSCHIMTNVIFLVLYFDKRDIFSGPSLREGTDAITPENKALWQPWFGQPWCIPCQSKARPGNVIEVLVRKSQDNARPGRGRHGEALLPQDTARAKPAKERHAKISNTRR